MKRNILKNYGWVAAGGMIGASLRYGTSLAVFHLADDHLFYLATAIENMLGSFLIGAACILLAGRGQPFEYARLFLITGVIGSYTTYSGFMVDAFLLLNESPLIFLIYFFGQVFFGLIFVFAGMKAGNRIMKK